MSTPVWAQISRVGDGNADWDDVPGLLRAILTGLGVLSGQLSSAGFQAPAGAAGAAPAIGGIPLTMQAPPSYEALLQYRVGGGVVSGVTTVVGRDVTTVGPGDTVTLHDYAAQGTAGSLVYHHIMACTVPTSEVTVQHYNDGRPLFVAGAVDIITPIVVSAAFLPPVLASIEHVITNNSAQTVQFIDDYQTVSIPLTTYNGEIRPLLQKSLQALLKAGAAS